MRQLERARLAVIVEQPFALTKQQRKDEHADLVEEAGGKQSMYELRAALRDEEGTVLLFQFRDILTASRSATEPFQVRSTPLREATYSVIRLEVLAMSSDGPLRQYGQYAAKIS